MKFLVTNIKYSIIQEDIDDYREYKELDAEVTDEEIEEEIQNSLPSHLVVEADYNSDDYDEEICDCISDETGWCIEGFNEEPAVNYVVSKLNNFMEFDNEFWEKEFGCDFDDIVNLYGFGWSTNKKTGEEELSYVSGDNLINISTPVENIIDKIFEAKDNVEKMRELIFWIYENND